MRTITLSLMLSLGGCVTQGTYDLLKTDRDHLEEELSARNKSLEEAAKKLSHQDDQRARLEEGCFDVSNIAISPDIADLMKFDNQIL
jgi:hypothetical protein